jgi:hypothetical protein
MIMRIYTTFGLGFDKAVNDKAKPRIVSEVPHAERCAHSEPVRHFRYNFLN